MTTPQDMSEIVRIIEAPATAPEGGSIGDLVFVEDSALTAEGRIGQLYVCNARGGWYKWPGMTPRRYEDVVETLRATFAAQARWGAYFQAGMV